LSGNCPGFGRAHLRLGFHVDCDQHTALNALRYVLLVQPDRELGDECTIGRSFRCGLIRHIAPQAHLTAPAAAALGNLWPAAAFSFQPFVTRLDTFRYRSFVLQQERRNTSLDCLANTILGSLAR
jgi:hypothetical protein